MQQLEDLGPPQPRREPCSVPPLPCSPRPASALPRRSALQTYPSPSLLNWVDMPP